MIEIVRAVGVMALILLLGFLTWEVAHLMASWTFMFAYLGWALLWGAGIVVCQEWLK